MSEKDYLESIGINKSGEYTKNNSYVVDILDSNEYGKIFTILDKSDNLDILQDNQVITVQGSSLMYEALDEPFILNLLADFDNNIYQLVVTKVRD